METAVNAQRRTAVNLWGSSSKLPGRGISVPRRRWRPALALLVKGSLPASILFVCVSRFANLDSGEFWSLLAGAGWSLGLVLVPPVCALAAETGGLVLCLPEKFSTRSLVHALPARIGCDALANAIPGGVAMAETLRPLALSRALDTSIRRCVAACLMGKVNMAASQAIFLAMVAGALLVSGESERIMGPASLEERAGVIAVGGMGGLFGLLVFLYSGPRCTQLSRLCARIPYARWRLFLEQHADSFHAVDAHISHFAHRDIRALTGSVGLFTAGWICAGLESYAILAVLGADVSVPEGMLLEGIASLLRISFFFLPSAIGVAEVSYVSLITAFGIADPVAVAAAFIAVKRSREFLWASGGALILLFAGLLGRIPGPDPVSTPDVAAEKSEMCP